MSEHSEVKCAKCGTWWPKSYLIDGLCWLCDGRYQKYLRDSAVEKENATLREGISALVRTYDGVKDWKVTTPTGATIKLSDVLGSCAEHLRKITETGLYDKAFTCDQCGENQCICLNAE